MGLVLERRFHCECGNKFRLKLPYKLAMEMDEEGFNKLVEDWEKECIGHRNQCLNKKFEAFVKKHWEGLGGKKG